MNPELPHLTREELEVRLTALLLGELPPAEAGAMMQLVANDAELGQLLARLKLTIGLVRAAAAVPAHEAPAPEAPRQLAPERREKLLKHFKLPTPRQLGVPLLPPKKKFPRWILPALAGTAVLVIMAGLFGPTLGGYKASQKYSITRESVSLGLESPDRVVLAASEAAAKALKNVPPPPPSAKGISPTTPAEPPPRSEERFARLYASDEQQTKLNWGGTSGGVGFGGGSGGGGAGGPNVAGVAVAGKQSGLAFGYESDRKEAEGRRESLARLADGTTATATSSLAAPANTITASGTISVNAGFSGGGAVNQPTAAGGYYQRRYGVAENSSGVTEDKLGRAQLAEKDAVLQVEAGDKLATQSASQWFAKAAETTRNLDRSGDSLFRRQLGETAQQAPADVSGGDLYFDTAKAGEASKDWDFSVATADRPVSLGTEVAVKVKVAPARPASGTRGNGVTDLSVRLPMPTLKGTPEQLVEGKNIENLEKTLAQQRAHWGEIQQAVTAPEDQVKLRSVSNRKAGDSDVKLFAKFESAPGFDLADGVSEAKPATATPAAPQLALVGISEVTGTKRTKLTGAEGAVTGLARDDFGGLRFRADANGSAAEKQPASVATPVPVLGDVPTVGRFFLEKQSQEAATPVQADQQVELNYRSSIPGSREKAELELKRLEQASREESLAKEERAKQLKAEPQPSNPEPGQATSDAYASKKRELEDLVQFKKTISLKLLSEQADVNLPKTAMVEIVNRATPATKPTASTWERMRGAVTGGHNSFESAARIRLHENDSDFPVLYQAQVGFDPYLIQTEFETIQSKPVLAKAAEALQLSQKWAQKYGQGRVLQPDETLALLKQKLNLKPVGGTSLVEIGAKSDQPEEAAAIANAVALAYADYRLAQRKQLAPGGVQTLGQALADQEKKIAKAEKELAELGAKDAKVGEAEPASLPKPPPGAPVPQPEVVTAENPFSTFSLNVADVSFKLAQASLEKGVMPEAASIRSEEFINALDYRDPEPAPGAPIAFAWERSRYPFAHNRDALRFSIKTAAAGRAGNRPLNLVLLLDNSGSMERADRVQIIREALRVLATQLQPQDKVSVVAFARTARLWVDGLPGSQAGELVDRVGNLTPQGGTNLEDAMAVAYRTALGYYMANGMNRVVLLTDGAANLGDVSPASLKEKVEHFRKQGIALDCFGIGWEGYNDDLLETLSRNGDGRYGFVNTPEAAATEFAAQLAGALQVAASDVKVQVEFNPARVTAYRQVGYAKHQLTKEQFRDNTVDAAEIAAAEAGNGLYIIEANPQGQGAIATVRVRYKVPGTSDYRELEWTVPYTGAATALEQASPAMRLCVTAAAFSEWLAGSPFAGEVNPSRLLPLLAGVPQIYGADKRPEKLEWMVRQAKSVAGQ